MVGNVIIKFILIYGFMQKHACTCSLVFSILILVVNCKTSQEIGVSIVSL